MATSRTGEIGVVDANGRERERYKIPYGAVILVVDEKSVKAGERLAKWDAHTHPIVTEIAGFVTFQDFEDGITVTRETDDITGMSTLVITDTKSRGSAGKRSRGRCWSAGQRQGQGAGTFPGTDIPAAYLAAAQGDHQHRGRHRGEGGRRHRLVSRSEASKSPRHYRRSAARGHSDLFEARKPKDPAVLAEASGTIRFGQATKGKQRLKIVTSEGDEVEQLIPKWTQITVFEGEHVEAGEIISDGEPSPHDILRLQGVTALANYLVKEIQDVYRLQGVRINDKHIETIIRQMLRKVEIGEPGDTRFLQGEQAEIFHVLAENRKIKGKNERPAQFHRQLLGITKASLSTESFISAASFQETTRVPLTEASVRCSRDEQRGLKENVIVGRLIPAGTGLAHHEQRRKARGGSLLADLQVASGAAPISDLFDTPVRTGGGGAGGTDEPEEEGEESAEE